MRTATAPVENIARIHGRGLFLSILEKELSLNSISVFNMTKTLKLKGNYLYFIGCKNAKSACLSGEQIW